MADERIQDESIEQVEADMRMLEELLQKNRFKSSFGNLRDLAEDVASTLGGIQADVFDEDELLEELAAMAAEEEVTLDHAEQTPVAVGAAVLDAAAFPAPPRGLKTKALERKSLLANDSATEGMAMGDA